MPLTTTSRASTTTSFRPAGCLDMVIIVDGSQTTGQLSFNLVLQFLSLNGYFIDTIATLTSASQIQVITFADGIQYDYSNWFNQMSIAQLRMFVLTEQYLGGGKVLWK